MSFDLVAVGGTGQLLFLELLLRKQRGEMVTLPRQVWIIDPHQPDEKGTLPSLVKANESKVGIEAQRIKPRRSTQSPTLDDVIGQKLVPSEPYVTLRAALEASLTTYERSYSTASGFFALPRLAATWIALAGMEISEPFLEEEYLALADGHALVIAGSLAGGTGAGLIPQLLLRARRTQPVDWKRNVLVFAMLPWFNPERGAKVGMGETVAWDQCVRNAADGVRALQRITGVISARVPEGKLDIAETHCALAGISPAQAREVPPPNPARLEESGVAPAFIRASVESLLLLTQPRAAETKVGKEKIVFGPAPVRGGGEGADASDPLAIYKRGDGYVATQIRTLTKELTAKREQVAGPNSVSLHRGFGSTIGRLLLTRSLTGFTLRDAHGTSAWKLFWEAWSEQTNRRADALDDGRGEVIVLARNVSRTVAAIDKAFAREDVVADLLARAETQPETAAAAAVEVADRLCNVLFSASAEERALKQKQTFAHLMPPVLSATRGAATGRLGAFEKTEVQQLAELYQPATFLTFYGASYARTFGQVHKLCDLIADSTPQKIREKLDVPVVRALLTLWRAAMHGILEYRSQPIDPRDRVFQLLIEREELTHDFGESITTVSYLGRMIGYRSVDLGFVPHVGALDELGRDEDAKRAFSTCSNHPTLNAHDFPLLRAFAEYAIARHGVKREMPWARLLLAAAGDDEVGDAAAYLEKGSIPSRPLTLRRGPAAETVDIPLPRLMEATALDALRAIGATVHAREMFAVQPGRSALVFKHFDSEVELARLSIAGDRNYVTEVVPADVMTAARYVERNGTGSGLIETTWR